MRRPRVLFVIHDVYQDDNYFPSGPAYMSAILEREGIDVVIANMDIHHWSNEEFACKFLDDQDWDIIGVGFLAARFSETIEPLCQVISQRKKKAWLVLGGPGPSPIPDYMLKKTGADVIVLGECESHIADLVRVKKAGEDLSKVPGVAFFSEGHYVETPRNVPIKDLDEIPYPAYHLFPMKAYSSCLHPFNTKPDDVALGILTSRGCVNRCNFCYRMEKGIRFRSIPNVIGEMKQLQASLGVNYFVMYDELFVVPKKRVLEFRDALKTEGMSIKYSCNARVDLFDREVASALKESGCQFLNFGMESSDQRVLDLMNKRATVEENIRAAKLAREEGLGLGLNFIWGNKGDTAETLARNVELIKTYNTYDQLRTIRPVTPYPGCDLYWEAVATGKLSGPEDFFKRFTNSDLFTVNFTDLTEERFYECLLAANSELITDHYTHTGQDMQKARDLIDNFRNLYTRRSVTFRGARHYAKKPALTEDQPC